MRRSGISVSRTLIWSSVVVVIVGWQNRGKRERTGEGGCRVERHLSERGATEDLEGTRGSTRRRVGRCAYCWSASTGMDSRLLLWR